MKFVLATPPFNLFEEGYGTKGKVKKGHLQPLGVGYLAAAAINAGIDTAIVDSSVLGLDTRQAAEMIMQHKPDAVGISTLTAAKDRAFGLVDELKKNTKAAIILGGPHATCFSQDIISSYENVDYVVKGEGDKTIAGLLKHIEAGTPPYDVKGIMFRDKGSIVDTGDCEIERDMDRLEFPARHLYLNNLYAPLPHARRRLPATSIITGRGCPYSKCAFCFSSGKMKKPFRRHSPARVVDEIEHVTNNFGVKEIIFCDDNFIFNRKWIFEFCELINKKGIDVSWSCTGRADTVDPDMLKAVKSAGCWTVFYGIESASQHILDRIKKGITLEQVENAVRWTHEAGLETRGSFIFALPGETPDDAEKGIRLAISLDLDYALFHAAFPEPGTEMYDTALAYGRFEEYRGMNKATFIPEGYKDSETIEKVVQSGYRRFYLRPRYIAKRIMSIRSFSDIMRYIEGFAFIKGM